MPRLTTDERKSFRANQLTELDRMSTTRQDKFLEPDPTLPAQEIADTRAKIIGRWANLSVAQLKARVNIDSFNSPLTFSSDNKGSGQYLPTLQGQLNLGWKAGQGKKAEDEIPNIVTQVADMEGQGKSADEINNILWARGS